MKDNYSFLTPFYNPLTKLIFGEQLMLAKRCFVSNLTGKKILIIGGGDGLDYQVLQENLSGEYWEISQSMLNRAKVNLGKSDLSFHLDFFQAKEGKVFDEVWLHFVLDTMLDKEIESLLGEIRKSLKPEGKIYLADFFAPKNNRHRFIHQAMISFFRLVTKHKRANLPDYEQLLQSNDWEKTIDKEFLKGWVKAQIWILPAGA
ncbi:class I SAM-dependent methyltransferase [Algoriphagus yeomjeoni]|uniref:class I SAM-dependent methyltransferase n=1 Tax=Algoriphagus yeomjeoni TaxID=291403 RepID=UPI003CE59E92